MFDLIKLRAEVGDGQQLDLNTLVKVVKDREAAKHLPRDSARELCLQIDLVGGILSMARTILHERLAQPDAVEKTETPCLLTVEQAAAIAQMKPSHLVERTQGKTYKWRRKVGHKTIRFEESGFRRWLAGA